MHKSPVIIKRNNSPIKQKISNTKSASSLNKSLKEHLSSLNLIKKLNELTNMKTAKKEFSPSKEVGKSMIEYTAQKAKSAIEENTKKPFFGNESKKKRQLMEILGGFVNKKQGIEVERFPSKNSSLNKSRPKSKSNEKSKQENKSKSKVQNSQKKSLNQIFSSMKNVLSELPRKSGPLNIPINFQFSPPFEKKHKSVDPNFGEIKKLEENLNESWTIEEFTKAISKIEESGKGSQVLGQFIEFMHQVLNEISAKKTSMNYLEAEKEKFLREKGDFQQEITKLRKETKKFDKVLESSFNKMIVKASKNNSQLKEELTRQKSLIRRLQNEIRAIKARECYEEDADESRKFPSISFFRLKRVIFQFPRKIISGT